MSSNMMMQQQQQDNGVVVMEGQQQQQQGPLLTSTTAPGKFFASRAELAAHYKSDWHKYNLKRREAGLPVLLEPDFLARLAAAKALRDEAAAAGGGTGSGGTDHLKSNNTNKKYAKKQQQLQQKKGNYVVSQVPAYDRIKAENAAAANAAGVLEKEEVQEDTPSTAVEDIPMKESVLNEKESAEAPKEMTEQQQLQQQQQHVEIDPRRCLFDRHLSLSVQANVDRMNRKYGFFIPDVEYLQDLQGLIGYCHEKIQIGYTCLYCERMFPSGAEAVQKHMLNKRHCKLRYEAGYDLEDVDVFYNWSAADAEFLQHTAKLAGSNNPKSKKSTSSSNNKKEEEKDVEMEDGQQDQDGWEDVSDDEAGANDEAPDANDDDDDDDDEEELDQYQEQVASMGLDVTPLGELIFPDGRIIGHRSLRRYYKQKARVTSESTAVVAARQASGERLYRGNVYNIHSIVGTQNTTNIVAKTSEAALALAQVGIAPGTVSGRAGRGILTMTAATANGRPVWSQLSVYRYRAAVRKQRVSDKQGQRLKQRTELNMNRMDKKANRLMNGVSVAHAAR